jgi:N-acetylmuramic acid 6-phosphate etherase
MVDVQPSNAKLRRRAVRILQDATGAVAERARAALEATGYKVKPALVMLLSGVDAGEARRRLAAADGFVRQAIAFHTEMQCKQERATHPDQSDKETPVN